MSKQIWFSVQNGLFLIFVLFYAFNILLDIEHHSITVFVFFLINTKHASKIYYIIYQYIIVVQYALAKNEIEITVTVIL